MNKSSVTIQPSYTQELNFEQVINSDITQLWARREEGFIQSFDKTRLYWIKISSAHNNKAIVIVNGRIECVWKYQELFFDLFQQGYNIYSFDHRGKGLSERLIDDSQMGYVDDFEDYTHDLHHLVQHFSLERYKSLYLMGHSMGGNIVTRYLQTYPQHPFAAIALSAPMFGVNLPWHLQLVAIPFNQLMAVLSSQPKFAPGNCHTIQSPLMETYSVKAMSATNGLEPCTSKNRNLKLVALATGGCGKALWPPKNVI